MTDGYVQHGTTSLSAALDVASGSVIAQHIRRHRHQEFLRLLKLMDTARPVGLDVHLICNNYATHKIPEVHKWHARRQLLREAPIEPSPRYSRRVIGIVPQVNESACRPGSVTLLPVTW